jgi:hypothetical protein
MLAIVEDEQQATRSQRGRQGVNERPARLLRYPQRRGHRVRCERAVGQRSQLDQDHAIGVRCGRAACDFDGQTRLADATWSGKRQEAGSAQKLEDSIHIPFPADKARQGRRQGGHFGEANAGPLPTTDGPQRHAVCLAQLKRINEPLEGARIRGTPRATLEVSDTPRAQARELGQGFLRQTRTRPMEAQQSPKR